MKKLLVISLTIYFTLSSFAQETKFSKHQPVRENDIMWRKTIWRQLDLDQKENVLFSKGANSITANIFDYVNNGDLIAYKNDSLLNQSVISINELNKNLEIPGSCNGQFQDEGDIDSLELTNCMSYYMAQDLTEMEIKEVYVFDKQHSRMVIQPVALTFFVSAEHPLNSYGFQIPILSIDFVALEKVEEKNNDKNWFNPVNEQNKLTYSEAIHQRKYHGHVSKINNPWDEYLDQYMSEEQAFWTGVNIDNELREYEYGLWVDHP